MECYSVKDMRDLQARQYLHKIYRMALKIHSLRYTISEVITPLMMIRLAISISTKWQITPHFKDEHIKNEVTVYIVAHHQRTKYSYSDIMFFLTISTLMFEFVKLVERIYLRYRMYECKCYTKHISAMHLFDRAT